MNDRALPWDTWKAVATLQVALTGTMAAATLLAPRTLLRLFGVAPSPGSVLFFRAFGAALAYVAVSHQGIKDTRDAAAVRTITIANVVEDGILTLLSLHGVQRGTLGKAGWVLVGVFASEVALNAWLAAQFSKARAEETAESPA
jgi:hypothetical protein